MAFFFKILSLQKAHSNSFFIKLLSSPQFTLICTHLYHKEPNEPVNVASGATREKDTLRMRGLEGLRAVQMSMNEVPTILRN